MSDKTAKSNTLINALQLGRDHTPGKRDGAGRVRGAHRDTRPGARAGEARRDCRVAIAHRDRDRAGLNPADSGRGGREDRLIGDIAPRPIREGRQDDESVAHPGTIKADGRGKEREPCHFERRRGEGARR